MLKIQETTEQFKETLYQSLFVIAGIPAFNEEKTIAKVVLSAQKYSHKVIVCDDGSSDLTALIAERLGAIVVRHPRNLGYGAALKSLFKRARELNADVLVTLDSDGQHDPSEIPLLVKPIAIGAADVVLGSRFLNNNGTDDMPAYRRLGIKVITKLANGSGKHAVSDAQSGFRSYSKAALDKLSLSENGMSASIELLREVGKSDLRVCEVPVSCKYANSVGVETSTENPLTHGLGIISSIIRLVIEERPLLFLGFPGLISLSIGVGFGFWMLRIFIQTRAIITNIALASITFIFIGFFMITSSIMLYAITRLANKLDYARNGERMN